MFDLIRQTFLNIFTLGAYNLYRSEKQFELNDKKQKENQQKYLENYNKSLGRIYIKPPTF
jgi:hypothetical protein